MDTEKAKRLFDQIESKVAALRLEVLDDDEDEDFEEEDENEDEDEDDSEEEDK